ncbi:MAG: NADH-quinone oxidoreductase subunit NuoF [Anaerolineae bacterium]|nr:NADH-quinone oxidoreductase subunit NuoF [Anaerolineae bacterium]RIK23886.1 MAG: NADH-quinone oxidoreductase subunit NuoF [Anaerolineae bacterium]
MSGSGVRDMEYVLLRHREIPNLKKLDVYREHGGYEGLKKALSMTQAEVIDLIKASNLRGRGGAGFGTGIKWSFIPKNAPDTYVLINTDESETGTFKDRELIENNPHQVIEGALIAAYAIGSRLVFNYMRGEFMDAAYAFEEALQECRAAGIIGQNILGSDYSVDFYTHYGAGAYICGEETALIESLAGNLGQPWSKPPFPAIEGLYSKPTVVNNTETLANVPMIMVNGPDWFKAMGTPQSPGPKIVCISGHVEKPGNYEVTMGMTYRELLAMAGGMRGGKKFKALLPSGGSGPIVVEDALDAPLTYEGLTPFDSVMGSASLIFMDEDTDMVWATLKVIHFFRHESCGKCTPCREGTFWLERVVERVYYGRGTEADIKLLESITSGMKGKCLCALGEFATSPIVSSIKHFLPEYKAKVAAGMNGKVTRAAAAAVR